MAEFKLPDLGEGITEGEVVEWRVGEGAQVVRDQVLLVIGTDKATVEIPSPFEGRVEAILAAEGARVQVGDPLIRVEALPGVGQPVAPLAAAAPQTPSSDPGILPDQPVRSARRPQEVNRVRALPAVRRAARQRGVSLEAIDGSGPEGRVRLEDLGPNVRRVPLRGARRLMALRMAEAHRRVPQVTVVLECDVGPLEALLGDQRAGRMSNQGYTLLGLVCLATLAEVRAQPIFNASFDEEQLEVVYQDQVNLGIAVQTDDGLKVAGIPGSELMAPGDLQAELTRLVGAAKGGTLTARELSGATFTVSSGGRMGGLLATPLVNWPNVATLGVHAIQDRPVVRDGQVAVGRLANLSLSFDHRVIDGMAGAGFLYEVVRRLAAPAALIH